MEFYFPMQSFDFACSVVNCLGNNMIKETTFCPDSHQFAKTVCEIRNDNSSGSGVVVATRSTPFTVKGRPVYALVLTAGHVSGNILRSKPLNEEDVIEISFEYAWGIGMIQEGFLLKDYSNWTNLPQYDEIMWQNYVVPCDLALIAVTSQCYFDSTICDTFDHGDNITIVGYPKMPKIIEYCAPFLNLEPDTLNEKKIKIKNAFCGFNKRVFCEGNVLSSSGSYMICGDYSGTSGMSGSPIFLGDHVCGINVGGAALKFQYEIGTVIGFCQRDEWDIATHSVQAIEDSLKIDASFDFSLLENTLDYLKFAIDRKNFDTMIYFAAGLMQKIAIAFKEPLKLSHNLAISCTHPVFQEAKRVCLKFKSSADMSFADSTSFYNDLTS